MVRHPIRLLLIEDNPGQVRLIQEMLADSRRATFDTESCNRLETAAEILTQKQFDAILLDLGLPGSRGIETLRRTKDMAPDLPIVVLTALEDKAVGLEALRQGAQDYLVKGQAGGEELTRCLVFSIERKHMRDHLRVQADILRVLNRSRLDIPALREVASRLRAHLDVEALGMRLEEENGWPLLVSLGYQSDFLSEAGDLRPTPGEVAEGAGPGTYACFCGAVLSGEVRPTAPWKSESGGVYGNRLSEVPEQQFEAPQPPARRGCCWNAGFESLALVPLRTEDRTVGMIQAADSRPDAFDQQDLSMLHNAGESIAIALCRQRAEDALSLRQRVLARESSTEHSIVSSGSAHEAANIAASTLCNLLQCDRATIVEFDLEREKVFSRGASGVTEYTAGSPGQEFPLDWFPMTDNFQAGQLREIRDLGQISNRAPMDEAWLQAGVRSCLNIPLMADAEFIGALNVGWARPGSPDDIFKTTACRFADMVSAVLLNFRTLEKLHRTDSTLRTARHEMDVARAIQKKLYPKSPPSLEGFDIGGISVPASTAGGDYFDYIPLPDGSLYVAVGDAVGHSTGAALVMASTRAYLRSFAEVCPEMDRVLQRVNKLLAEEVTADLFCTLSLLRLKGDMPDITWLNAGHPAVFVLDSDGGLRTSLESNAFPLGVLPEAEMPAAEELRIEPGEMLVLFTDGVLEARSEGGDIYGHDRALEVVRHARNRPAQEIAEAMYAAVKEFCGAARPHDDVTCVVIKRHAGEKTAAQPDDAPGNSEDSPTGQDEER